MAHEITFTNGVAEMAWAGRVPWHGLGTQVSENLTPQEMREAAGIQWEVEELPNYIQIPYINEEGETKYRYRAAGNKSIVRNDTYKVLTIGSENWKPIKNEDAFNFFNEFVEAGHMTMETAGSLKGGEIVWALAKINESIELFSGQDRIDGYLLFSNRHKYGFATEIMQTDVRVVCNNTFVRALNTKSKSARLRFSHTTKFDPEVAKQALAISKINLTKYKEQAEFLASKRFNNDQAVEFYKTVFPIQRKANDNKEVKPLLFSKNAELANGFLTTQPGADLGAGTFWALYNSVTFITDHVIGKTTDSRLSSAWFGPNRKLKQTALDIATELAKAA